MEKLLLVIKREYWTRVRKPTFILATILTPLGIGLFFVVMGFIMTYEGEEKRHVAIIDSSNILGEDVSITSGSGLSFEKTSEALDKLKQDERFDAVLELPPLGDLSSSDYEVNYYSDEGILGVGVLESIKGGLERNVYRYKAEQYGFEKAQLESLDTDVSLERKTLDDSAPEVSTNASYTAMVIGGVMGFFMYFAVFLYGMMVLRSVSEEKTNRIVEIMVSSVKPFQLMMGKIIGVGLVGLTQVLIWAIMIPIILVITQLIFGMDPQAMQEASANMPGSGDTKEAEQTLMIFIQEIKAQNWLLILPLFVVYFLGGYIMYSSLFAAVGSAVGDDTGESQSLTLPISLPVLIAFYMMFAVIRSPESWLASFASIFPLFSPIVMPARLAFSPPWWEIVLSLVVLILSVIFFVWLSGRIYRIGILMYGKKASFKEIGKWIFRKD